VVELGGRTVDYTYDALYRLTGETIVGAAVNGAIGYVYDAVGNRLSRNSTVVPVSPANYTYDANDRLLSDAYESNGNTVASGGAVFTYDFENRLKTKNGTEVVMVYDGDGNRVAKTVGGVTTRHLVDDRNLTGYAQVLEEIVGGVVQRVYTYGLNRISQSQSSAGTFYGYDGHGSVRILTDATDAVTDRYDYDAFGAQITRVGTTTNSYLFSGEQFDSDLNVYYNRARYLNPTVGRFLSMDAVAGNEEDPKSLHRYLYAAGDPVNQLDPSGDQSIGEVMMSIAISAQLAVMAHPVLTAVITTVLLALAPEDFLTALPPFIPEAGFANVVRTEAQELRVVRRAYEAASGVARMQAGRAFERWMIENVLRNIPKLEQLVVKDGAAVAGNARIRGSAVIDAIIRGVITEFKTSFGAVKKYQLQQFAKYAQNTGMPINYTFLVKPTPQELQIMKSWIAEVAKDVALSVSYVIPR
jgi:RHS repeat-associated protein